jgi:hypothetical protein
MTTTTDYGQIVGTTLTDEVLTALGEHADTFDLAAIVADYRAAIQAQLPTGVTVHGEGVLYGPYPRIEFDRAAVLEAVDFWAIVARHDSAIRN